ncbi:NAD-dependent epimerase/dehydratase family protein [Aporhodopirellula aestuarii]|uniref:SDR family NAD(P)-dependent oxidoreductase n=1 Tax=Aporhodopirellula aestuarii TaxID=2950107 RepID=A0ABT0UCN0_9BACT|nr:NAD-dependent epimerase/dehydratase family protein [Aporhodopirellula aestuarii]MCM2374782.1 SDR family NAD(P)-dependent oxidoreductase [Aporhodopirellula aestuarii]
MNVKNTNYPPSTPSLLIIGCGYLGTRVGWQARAAGWSVAATSRTQLAKIANQEFHPVRFDWNDSRDLQAILEVIERRKVDRVLVSVSYDRTSSVDRFVSQVDGLSRLLRSFCSLPQRLGCPVPDVCYISTTGVYHQIGGVWVDERSPTHPTRDGGRAHLQAEAKMRARLGHSPWTILRLSGIYGPGRVPRAADVRAGRPIASPPDGHLNLIHVDDAAAAVIAAFSRTPPNPFLSEYSQPRRERLYVVSDDRPVVRRRFYEEIARQTRSKPPEFIDPAADSGVRFRSETDKRIWNRQFKRDLLPTLRYPSFVEGLRDIL